jgi:hypothetical protein
MTDIEKKLAELNGVQEDAYAQEVTRLIRRKYSLSQELALERQRYRKPEEFAEYDAYCEQCKAEAKKEIYGGTS